MRLTTYGLERYAQLGLQNHDGGSGAELESDLGRLLDLYETSAAESSQGVQSYLSTFMVNDGLSLSTGPSFTDPVAATSWAANAATGQVGEGWGLPTGGAVVESGGSEASPSHGAPPGMVPWSGGFAHEGFVCMEADTATREHDAALEAATPGRGPLQPVFFGFQRSAQSFGWESSAQMEANVGWGAPDDPDHVESGNVYVTISFAESVEADPASAADHRNGADLASDSYSPGGAGTQPAIGSTLAEGARFDVSGGWSDLNGADLQSDTAAATASPGGAPAGAVSVGAGTVDEGTGVGVEGDLTGHRRSQGNHVAEGSSDSSGVTGTAGAFGSPSGVSATDRVGGNAGTPGDGAVSLAGYNADGEALLETGRYAPQGEVREVSDAPALGPGARALVQGERGATPMRDGDGTLFYRISGGQRDGQIILFQPPVGASMETVVVTGSRSDNDADRALSGSSGLRLSSAQLDDALLLPPQVGQAGLVVVAAELRSGNPTLMALGGVAVVGAYGVATWLDGRGGPAQQVAWLPEDLRNPSPLVNPSAPGLDPLPGYTPHPERGNLLIPGGAADQMEGQTGPLPGFGADGQTAGIDDSIITRDGNANNNLDRARQRHAANPGLADPSQLIGTQVAGVGTWVAPETPRGTSGADYEEQVTGTPFGLELNVGGTVRTTSEGTTTATGGANFDGVRVEGSTTVLVDAKDWARFHPEGQSWWVDQVNVEARRQIDAVAGLSGNVGIEWVVPDHATAQAVRVALEERGYQDDISVVVQPKTGG